VTAHAIRVFFTGAFRKPRDLNWMFGVTLLLLTLAIGFTGYSLPDDLLSGTGIRIMYSLLLSIPFIGTWAAFLFFGGEYPAPDLLHRLFVIHIFILPLLIFGVISVHLALVWHQKHTHFPGHSEGQPERTETNIQGERLYPRYAFKSMGLFFGLAALLSLMGGLFQINPVWLYGPYSAHVVSGGAQPDWYMGWLEGGHDRIASLFGISVEAVTRLLRVMVVALPALAFVVTYWLCNELRRSGMHPIRQSKTGEVKRTITGGYETGGEAEGGGFRSVEEEQTPV